MFMSPAFFTVEFFKRIAVTSVKALNGGGRANSSRGQQQSRGGVTAVWLQPHTAMQQCPLKANHQNHHNY